MEDNTVINSSIDSDEDEGTRLVNPNTVAAFNKKIRQ